MSGLINAGLEGFGLTLEPDVCQKLEKYLSELLRWNRQVNLTAITDPEEAREKHLIDSLILLTFLEDATSLLDMGSGGGLPGIPLQIVRPDLEVVSVDSVGKKVSFQRHIKRSLELSRFSPVQARLEHLSEVLPQDKQFDLVTARAFASLEKIVRLASPWLSQGGRILAMKGGEGDAELSAAGKILEQLEIEVLSIHNYVLPFSGATRQVIVMSKKNHFQDC